MKALKAFIKPFEVPHENKKFNLIFISVQLSEMHGTLRVNFQVRSRVYQTLISKIFLITGDL